MSFFLFQTASWNKHPASCQGQVFIPFRCSDPGGCEITSARHTLQEQAAAASAAFPASPAHFKALSFIAACLQTGASKHPLLSGHLYHNIAFDGIVLFQISEAFKYQTALVACIDFLHIILKPL